MRRSRRRCQASASCATRSASGTSARRGCFGLVGEAPVFGGDVRCTGAGASLAPLVAPALRSWRRAHAAASSSRRCVWERRGERGPGVVLALTEGDGGGGGSASCEAEAVRGGEALRTVCDAGACALQLLAEEASAGEGAGAISGDGSRGTRFGGGDGTRLGSKAAGGATEGGAGTDGAAAGAEGGGGATGGAVATGGEGATEGGGGATEGGGGSAASAEAGSGSSESTPGATGLASRSEGCARGASRSSADSALSEAGRDCDCDSDCSGDSESETTGTVAVATGARLMATSTCAEAGA